MISPLPHLQVISQVNIMWLKIAKLLYPSLFKRKSGPSSSTCVRLFSINVPKESSIEEKKIDINGVDINYAKVGFGDHPVLLLPGAIGSIWTDFKPQMELLDKEQLTVVAWDPPGYGKSRPPNRTFPDGFFRRDAAVAHNLMTKLGYSRYSLLGWSDGGITSLVMAATYPKNIHKLIVTGANAYFTPQEMNIYEKIRNIDTWSERMRAPLIALYGELYFQKIWGDWIDAMKIIFEKYGGDICKNDLPKIECATLIIHGKKDPMVLFEHPEYLKQNIYNSRVKYFDKGAHNLHLRYPEEFNSMVTKFLVEKF